MKEYFTTPFDGGGGSARMAFGYVQSPMNYTGGKFKLLPQIMPLFPKDINTFVDLFCGGCNVGVNVMAKKTVFNDNLTYLIDLYEVFNTIPANSIVSYLDNTIAEYALTMTNEDGYKNLRNRYNTERNPLDLFLLVAYSFNHQIRFNNSHEFNCPFGRERSSFNSRMRCNLYSFIYRLRSINAKFTCTNFENYDFEGLGESDFVYCDPPYLITTGAYNDGKRGFTGWSGSEEKMLLDILSGLNERNVHFALSNVLCHKGRQNEVLINWIETNSFHVFHLTKDYSNSNYHTKNRDRQSTDEVLVTNYKPMYNQLLIKL